MTALTLDLPDEKLRRLEVAALARGTSVARLFEEMSGVMLAEADAQTRFQLRAQRGARKEARGLELLDKALRVHDAPVCQDRCRLLWRNCECVGGYRLARELGPSAPSLAT